MKQILSFLLIGVFSMMALFPDQLDTDSFDIVFIKRGKCRIGFCDPDLIVSSAGQDESALVEQYKASEPSLLKFTLGDMTSGTVNATADIGMYWHLFPEGLEPENYTIDVIFTSDANESIAGNSNGMLVHPEGDILNYNVSITDISDVSVLAPPSFNPVDGGVIASGSATNSRHLRFSEGSVNKNGKLVAHKLQLSLNDVPYGTADGTQDGVKIGTYSGYIIMKLERV